MNKLTNNGSNEYYINCKRKFNADVVVEMASVQECFQFAFDMSFGHNGEHRNYRSGGQVRRRNGEIFINTFQGKIAEYGVCQYFSNLGYNLNRPDIQEMPLGSWDTCDFEINNRKIAVKSTKEIGNLLLLETHDWDENGNYVPNCATGDDYYDYFMFCRVAPDGVGIMKQNRWLYSDNITENYLLNAIYEKDWSINIAGFITHEEFVNEVVREEFILPQNSMLNGRTQMDAENYYVQSGDMHVIEQLMQLLW